MQVFVTLLFCGVVTICAGAENNWDYTDPAKWKDTFPNCGLKKQSPINIVDAECDKALNKSITFSKYNMAGTEKFKLENNGHTLQLTVQSTDASVKLGTTTFKLVQLHFHWGNDDSKGSEHQLKGKLYPAEMHLVHYNTKYSSIDDAVNKSDGLAVLGVFIKAGNENAAFKKFLNFTMNNVTYAGSSVMVNQFAIEDLLPTNTDEFYRYSGSLTTPACYQSVTWTVFSDAISLSEDQLKEFRSLKSHGKSLVNNFRPVQALNDRKITYWDNEACESGAQALGASLMTALLSVLLFFSVA